MSVFSPLTLGYDWETWALKQEMLPGDTKKRDPISDRVNTKLAPMEAHREWHFIEAGAGINRDWAGLLERTQGYFRWINEEFAKEELFFYPSGCIATERGSAGLHVHVGTANDVRAEMHILNALVPYLPPLMALMVNSPIYNWRHGKYKSQRMGRSFEGAGGVYTIAPAHLTNATWYGDVCCRRSAKPTLEVRLADSCMSPRLVCEYALVVAGLLDWMANHPDADPDTYTEDGYEEFLANRWRATRDGLQATFVVGGREVEARDHVRTIIDKAVPGMKKLNASVEDLVIIPAMLEKRQTQADFQLAYMRQLPEPTSFMRAFADVVKEPTVFEEYLRMVAELPQLEPADFDAEIEAKIGRDTKPFDLLFDPFLPPVLAEKKMRALEAEGKLTISVTPEDGIRMRKAGARETARKA